MTDSRPQVSYGSGAWWRTRTDQELRDAVDGNTPGGLAHDGAMLEFERRKAERAQARQLWWIRLTFVVAAAGATAAVAALL